MKERHIQIVVGVLAVIIVVLGLILGTFPDHKNVKKTLEEFHELHVFTDKRSYTVKETFPIHISTSGEYTITTAKGKISVNKDKNFKKKMKLSGDQVVYVKLNAKEDQTKIVIKNHWDEKTLEVKLDNGYYLFQ